MDEKKKAKTLAEKLFEIKDEVSIMQKNSEGHGYTFVDEVDYRMEYIKDSFEVKISYDQMMRGKNKMPRNLSDIRTKAPQQGFSNANGMRI